jgi:hypothetical protein
MPPLQAVTDGDGELYSPVEGKADTYENVDQEGDVYVRRIG